MRRARRLFSILLLGAAAFCLAGCGGETAADTPSPIVSLYGKILSQEPVSVVPAMSWTVESGLWVLDKHGSLLCEVRSSRLSPFLIRLEPEGETDLSGVRIFFDGQELEDRLDTDSEGRWVIDLTGSVLDPGRHVLSIVVDGADTTRTFRMISSEAGGVSREIDPSYFGRYQFLGSLLEFGVTASIGDEKLGGFVFEGPRSVEIPVEPGARFLARVQNASHQTARFSVSARETLFDQEIQPHSTQPIEVEVPAGARTMTLSVEGHPKGLFLWGAPLYVPPSSRRPPIILITMDTTRRDGIGVYSGSRRVTPNLDGFAETATLFTNAYSTAPWTLPSHASIFTGLYPSRHGAGVRSFRLDSGAVTLAERLRNAGYVTAGFPGGILSRYIHGVGEGFLTYGIFHGTEAPSTGLTDKARGVLNTFGDESLFLFVNYFDPHYPYAAPDRFNERFDLETRLESLPESSILPRVLNGRSLAMPNLIENGGDLGRADLSVLRAAYLAEVAAMDHEIGLLFESLRHAGLWDDALIIVTSDHGELLGEEGFYGHSCRLDPELMEIPLLIKWPGQDEAKSVDEIVSLVDLFPTILAAAGLPVPEQDGVSLDPSRHASKRLGSREAVLMEEHDREFHPLFERMKIADDVYALQSKSFKRIIWNEQNRCYGQVAGSWQTQGCGEMVSLQQIDHFLGGAASVAPDSGTRLSAEEREKLRALGYLR